MDKVFVTIGANNHTNEIREKDDYYATDPKAIDLLLEQEKFAPMIWEPACGEGHMSKKLEEHGYKVFSTDLIDRGYSPYEPQDFLAIEDYTWEGDIITNPPYKYAKQFVEKAMELIKDGGKVAMFLKLTFLESKKRKELFEKYPPKVVYVSCSRIECAKNGEFKGTSAVAYAWFVWEKGFKGDPIIKWIN